MSEVPLYLASNLQLRCDRTKKGVEGGRPNSDVHLIPAFRGVLRYSAERWTTRVSLPPDLEDWVTNFAPHTALKLMRWRKVDCLMKGTYCTVFYGIRE